MLVLITALWFSSLNSIVNIVVYSLYIFHVEYLSVSIEKHVSMPEHEHEHVLHYSHTFWLHHIFHIFIEFSPRQKLSFSEFAESSKIYRKLITICICTELEWWLYENTRRSHLNRADISGWSHSAESLRKSSVMHFQTYKMIQLDLIRRKWVHFSIFFCPVHFFLSISLT